MQARTIAEDFADLKEQVVAAGGMYEIQMRTLRDYVRAGRIDGQPIRDICENLTSYDLATVPEKLPRHQDDWVLIYTKFGPLNRIKGSLSNPGAGSGKRIRQAALELLPETQKELNRLRELERQMSSLVSSATQN